MVRQNLPLLTDLASIWAVQLARRELAQVWGSARTQLKIAVIGGCQGADEIAQRLQWLPPGRHTVG
jgi:hypothetical protein